MKITKHFKSRKLFFKPKVVCSKSKVSLPSFDLNIQVPENWESTPITKELLRTINFEFKDCGEFTEGDIEKITKSLFPPLFTFKANNFEEKEFTPFLFGYLWSKNTLTSDSNLHMRSINKYEVMWASYFVRFVGESDKNGAKNLLIGSSIASISLPLNFEYTTDIKTQPYIARLTILMIDLDSYVLGIYSVDSEATPFEQADILNLISTNS